MISIIPLGILLTGILSVEGYPHLGILEHVSREEWGGRAPNETQYMETPVPHLFIHHTETPECTSLSSCSARMRSIQNYHMDYRGWSDIGYNFLIGGDGRIYVGRGWNRVGAHTKNYNSNGIAFALIGNYTSFLPSETVLRATKSLMFDARSDNYLSSNYKLHGHRDAGCTKCPGDKLYDHIKNWPHFQAGPLPNYRPCN